jgi:hypothetical protein
MKKLFISHDRLSQALARGHPRPYLVKQWPLANLYGGQVKGGARSPLPKRGQYGYQPGLPQGRID